MLKEIREQAGKRQEDVCADLEISPSTVNRHERGKTRLSKGHRLMYASYYGVKPDEIEQPSQKTAKRATRKPARRQERRAA